MRKAVALFVLAGLVSACARSAPTTVPSPPPAVQSTSAPSTSPAAGSGRNEQTPRSPSVNTTIQFDTEGVEFGPWINRFTAHLRKHWFIPVAAMSETGRVVVTFYVWKDGRITDVSVAEPSAVESFNQSAQHAVVASNPTVPLPAGYPDEKAFFTITFHFK